MTNNLPLQTTRSLRSRASWTGGGSSVVSGGYSTLDYGSDVAYENSVVGTPSKGSEGGLEIEMEALSLEEQAAIIATSGDSRVNQQQERNTSVGLARSYSEEVGAMIQSRGEFKDNVVTDEVCSLT